MKTHFSSNTSNFNNITIKEQYEKIPQISYPMITIEELNNTEDSRYSSNQGEEFSSLSYQINIYTRDFNNNQATKVIRTLQNEINTVLGGDLGMVRSSITPPVPLPSDNTVLQSSIRYSCVFDIIRKIIYKD